MNIADIEIASASGPTRFGLHSVEGFGKTTLAAFFPAPVFLASERSFPRDLPFRPKKFPDLLAWPQAFEAVESLTVDKHDRQTLVVDTVDWLEPLIHRFVCGRDSGRKSEMNKGGHELISIEDYGYGKGYVAAHEEFRRFITALDRLQHERAMHVVLLMHSQVKKFENPSGLNFDRWEPKMHQRIARTCVEWVENLFFGFFEVEAGKLADEKRAKGVSTGRRLLGTRQNAMYDAKNRMNLPDVLELAQPEDMIPCLLGEHLEGAETPTKTSKPEPKTVETPRTETKAASKPKPEAKVEESKTTAKAPPQSTRTSDTEAKRSEPPKASEPPAKPAPKKSAAEATAEDIQVQALMKQVLDASTKAKTVSEKYGADVERWIGMAKGDHSKLKAIVNQVHKDTAASAA